MNSFEDNLLELIRSHPTLYRNKDKKHKSLILKENCWKEIAKSLNKKRQNVEITPIKAVRRIGDELIVLCKVPYQIDSCRMIVGTTSYRLIPGNQEGDVVYSGQGLTTGECGAHIKNIREDWNGNVTCVLPPQSSNIEVTGTMRLLVARAPGDPHLISPPQPQFKEEDIFSAQCVVPNGRPAAKILWFLDDEQLLEGVHQPVVTDEPGSDLQTVSQNITRTIRADDNNRMLACRAEHEALDQPREAKRQLIVHYPPKRLESGPITVFGLKLGAEGKLNVTVRSNPPPTAVWMVGDIRITAPHSTDNGAITALEPLHLGNGHYNVSLHLARITKEDVERTYYLQVFNDLGREEFTLRMSTMDEPAGVELDTGAIVGIVVAVLVLLIAVFLGVFAFATDRWCFAGRGRELAKNSGESTPAGDVFIESGLPLSSPTDTESAAGAGRSRLAALGARVRAVIPRAKDRVQATDAHDAESQSEEKKGVIYAELALGDQTSADKPPPPSTEYAEIVYTDQPGQKEVKE
ncbi:fasciclin-3 isoform X2 [Bombyx mandarina]|uniref:Fasciclin-3 isoform X2 n=1 Tax=Bombyx mandarina TaxID=7092 RepID=A0A6J2JWZ7_BOMMA|nr:fasciclin-3 isoform X2 [Bombyx mandarina]